MEITRRKAWKTCCLFIIVANLPFLTMVHLMGMDLFLASFHHPEMYQYLKVQNGTDQIIPEGYLLIEKPISRGFLIHNGDTILYRTGEGAVRCEAVLSVELRQGTTAYYTSTPARDDIKEPIYDTQVLGKVSTTVDDNLWNVLCLRLWDYSIQHLNVHHLF